jgi:hypothetical protein
VHDVRTLNCGLERPASQFPASATEPTDAKLRSQITEPRQCFSAKQHIHSTVLIQNEINPKIYFKASTCQELLPLNKV